MLKFGKYVAVPTFRVTKVAFLRLFVTVSALACLFNGVLWSQEAVSARLGGTVLDPNDAVVPAAKVTLSNPQTGFTRSINSSDSGGYTFTLIPPGTYDIKVEKEGFSAAVLSGIALTVGQATSLNLHLQVGAVSQSVQVEAAAPLLATGNANLGSDVTSKQVQELPLNWRNVFGLVNLDSSVNNSTQTQSLNPSGSQGNADQDIAFFNWVWLLWNDGPDNWV